MTSGTRTLDGRFTVDSFCASPPHNKAGPYYAKTWSGPNRTPDAVIKELVFDPNRKRYYIRKKRIRRYQKPLGYTMSLTRRSDAQVWATNRGLTGGNCIPVAYNQKYVRTCMTYPDATAWGSTPWTTNHEWDLLSKLHEKVWGSSFDPGVFLAESGKALRMIGDSAQRVAKSAYYARKGNIREAWKALGTSTPSGRRINVPKNTKISADHWASMRWGWVPLFQDMHDGAVWIAHQLHAPAAFRLKVRRVAQKNLVHGTWNTVTSGIRPSQCTWRVRKQLIAYLSEPPNTTVLNSVNPLSIAWELVPLSFVVDWALPIGTYLRTRGLPSMLQGEFVTTETSLKECRDLVGYGAPGTCSPIITSKYFGDGYQLEMSMTRTVSSSLTIPDVEFRGFEKVATWKHAVDSLALMTQRLKRLQVD